MLAAHPRFFDVSAFWPPEMIGKALASIWELGGKTERALVRDRYGDPLACPITHESLFDPVLLQDGHVYERAAIETWLARESRSPCSNCPMLKPALLRLTPVMEAFQDFTRAGEEDKPSLALLFQKAASTDIRYARSALNDLKVVLEIERVDVQARVENLAEATASWRRLDYDLVVRAALVAQKRWRRRQARQSLRAVKERLRARGLLILARYREHVSRRRHLADERRRSAALLILACCRKHVSRRRCLEERRRCLAARIIVAYWRRWRRRVALNRQLLIACSRGHVELANAFLEKGANARSAVCVLGVTRLFNDIGMLRLFAARVEVRRNILRSATPQHFSGKHEVLLALSVRMEGYLVTPVASSGLVLRLSLPSWRGVILGVLSRLLCDPKDVFTSADGGKTLLLNQRSLVGDGVIPVLMACLGSSRPADEELALKILVAVACGYRRFGAPPELENSYLSLDNFLLVIEIVGERDSAFLQPLGVMD